MKQLVITERDGWAWLAGVYSALWFVGWRKRAHRVKAAKSEAAAGQMCPPGLHDDSECGRG